MALLLNTESEYQAFPGRYHEQMQHLIGQGGTPMSVADVMRRRLDVADAAPAVRKPGWTSTLIPAMRSSTIPTAK